MFTNPVNCLKLCYMNITNKIKDAFYSLQKQNRFFVSEADFQHSFAMELEHVFNGCADVLLEFPIESNGRIIYIDIMVVYKNVLYPIELKYKTRVIPYEIPYGHTCLPINKILKNHGATDLGGYAFWHDINRLEQLANDGRVATGVCIMLTNDKCYWAGAWNANSKSYPFRILDGKYKRGYFQWQQSDLSHAPKWIIQHPGFDIKNDYEFQWCDFLDMGIKNGFFRYLLIEIPQHMGGAHGK